MKLSDYLSANGLSQTKFAEMTGFSEATVSRLCNGKQRPNWHTIAAVQRATGGAVQPNDFFEPAPSSEADAA